MADKLHIFVRTLKVRTDEGKINWQPTVEEAVYQAAFPNYLVKIWMRPTRYEQGGEDACIAILDKDGSVIEEFDDVALGGTGFGNSFTLMQELYRRARRRAMGLDRALDEMLSALGPTEPEPPSESARQPAEDSNQISDDDVPF